MYKLIQSVTVQAAITIYTFSLEFNISALYP
jgi:hypothetical protein